MVEVILVRRFGLACLLTMGLIGCEQQKQSGKQAPPEVERLAVSASAVTVGFQAGKQRQSVRVAAFEITPLPVTNADYAACVAARACAPQPLAEADEGELASLAPNDIASGVDVERASSYCTWLGGALPTLPQWQLAARGSVPQRFAWGNHLPTCEEHPGGVNLRTALGADERRNSVERTRAAATYEPCGSSASSRYEVDKHAAGVSSKGLKDVLLASTELLAKDPESIFGSCRGTTGFCEVYGSAPGAIDFVREAKPSSGREAKPAPAFAFRCAWSGGGDK